jgi:hypothetical protein
MIEELYAYVGTEIASRQEGIVSVALPGHPELGILPMVFATRRSAEMLEPTIRLSIGHYDVRLVRYTRADVLKEIA